MYIPRPFMESLVNWPLYKSFFDFELYLLIPKPSLKSLQNYPLYWNIIWFLTLFNFLLFRFIWSTLYDIPSVQFSNCIWSPIRSFLSLPTFASTLLDTFLQIDIYAAISALCDYLSTLSMKEFTSWKPNIYWFRKSLRFLNLMRWPYPDFSPSSSYPR